MISKTSKATWAGIAATALVGSAALIGPAAAAPTNNSASKLAKAVTLPSVMRHLEALQAISDEHGDRASGRPGYQASVDYVVEQLEGAGYDPQVQEFTFDYFEENSELQRLSPNPTTYVEGENFLRNAFDSGTPEGEATGVLTPVDLRLDAPGLPPNTSSSGCEAADFAGFPTGGIALMQRGTWR